jgi:hypothetical protein
MPPSSFAEVEAALGRLTEPREAEAPEKVSLGALNRALREAQRSLDRARRDAISTWLDYQVRPLDLYRDLGVGTPER